MEIYFQTPKQSRIVLFHKTLLDRADYWKSQAKKFCDFCKCWIADNKPSIEFHEKGKRHKENVDKRLSEIGKKSWQDHQKSLKIDDEMKKMEEAAMKAYMKDVEANPDFTSQLIKERLERKNEEGSSNEASEIRVKTEPESTTKVKTEPECSVKVKPDPDSSSVTDTSKTPVQVKTEPSKLWYEAQSDEGYTYYWHIESGESRWEPPEEGYMSIAEQKEAEKKELKKKEEKEKKKKVEEDKMKEEERARLEREKMKSRRVKEEDTKQPEYPGPILGPAPKPDPYGAWTVVETRIQEPVDLQLPRQEFIEIRVPVAKPETQVKFKEKTVSSLGDTEDNLGGGFKKRKFGLNPKRNMRQRTDADD